MVEYPSPIDLLGRWRLTRSIDDRLAGEAMTVDGFTELTQASDGRVRWHETGTLHRASVDVAVYRTLFVEQRDSGWMVTFEDGRDFHPWSPGTQVKHPCGDDTYTGHVAIDSADRWTVTWTSQGPAKDYTMVSTLER